MALTAKIRLLEQKLRQQEEELSTLRPKSQALEFELENAKQPPNSYTLGVNQFSDTTHEARLLSCIAMPTPRHESPSTNQSCSIKIHNM